MLLEVQYLESNRIEKVQIPGNKCIVGRSPKANLQIDMECFSRMHLEIEWDGKQFYATDLNSTNGVIFNGEKLQAGTKVLINSFFPLEVASIVAIVVLPE